MPELPEPELPDPELPEPELLDPESLAIVFVSVWPQVLQVLVCSPSAEVVASLVVVQSPQSWSYVSVSEEIVTPQMLHLIYILPASPQLPSVTIVLRLG